MIVLNKHVHNFKVKGNVKGNFWRVWSFWAIFLLISSFVMLLRRRDPVGVLLADCIFIWFPLLFSHDVLITVNTKTSMLRYYYLTGWGSLKCKKIDLKTAEGSYKTERGRGQQKYWRLVLYNGNGWFKKKVSVQEGKFSKSQLDEISKLIDECKSKITNIF